MRHVKSNGLISINPFHKSSYGNRFCPMPAIVEFFTTRMSPNKLM
jgi:hypothetical protein